MKSVPALVETSHIYNTGNKIVYLTGYLTFTSKFVNVIFEILRDFLAAKYYTTVTPFRSFHFLLFAS